MALALTLDAGRITATIPDARGREHPYAVEVKEPGLAIWKADVTPLDGRRQRTHTVTLDRVQGWTCTCEDARFAAKREQRHCKHCIAAYEVALMGGIMAEKPKAKKPEPTAAEKLRRALRNPFHPDEVKWKPQSVTKDGTKAMAVAYIDARAVMDRLDAVVGPMGWRDHYTVEADGSVICQLEIRDDVSGEWVPREDVGGESEQPDKHDRRKSAFSDALKRAAVKFGIGRYLYHLPRTWCRYDSAKRRLLETPSLPAWAMPDAVEEPPPPPAEEETAQPVAATPAPTPARSPADPPTWVKIDQNAKWLVDRGECDSAEDLTNHLHQKFAGVYGDSSSTWPAEAWPHIKAEIEVFRAARRATRKAQPA